MVYTVGPKKIYHAQLEVWGSVKKMGRNDNYLGGCVFQTIENAHCFIAKFFGGDFEKYEVFGIAADWETDTTPSEDDWWNYLLVGSEIFRLDTLQPLAT